MLILARHVSWDMRSSCFYQVISETMIAISETMTAQIVLEVQIALMTDLSADRSISLIQEPGESSCLLDFIWEIGFFKGNFMHARGVNAHVCDETCN